MVLGLLSARGKIIVKQVYSFSLVIYAAAIGMSQHSLSY